MNRKEQPGGGYATTFLTGRERILPLPHAGRGWPDGDDLMYSTMILPFSHSPSVIKPSQAMRTARHQNGGRCNSYVNGCRRSSGLSPNALINTEQPHRKTQSAIMANQQKIGAAAHPINKEVNSMNEVFSSLPIEIEQNELDERTVQSVYQAGYSRITECKNV